MIRKIVVCHKLAILFILSQLFMVGMPVRSKADVSTHGTFEKLRRIFAGFAFSGAYACPGLEVPVHSYKDISLPQRLVAEQCYVFHARSSDEAVHRLLMQRFESEKVELTRYPKSETDLVYLMAEGPLFRLDFRTPGSSGSVIALQGSHNAAPPAGWRAEDYVLRLNK